MMRINKNDLKIMILPVTANRIRINDLKVRKLSCGPLFCNCLLALRRRKEAAVASRFSSFPDFWPLPAAFFYACANNNKALLGFVTQAVCPVKPRRLFKPFNNVLLPPKPRALLVYRFWFFPRLAYMLIDSHKNHVINQNPLYLI